MIYAAPSISECTRCGRMISYFRGLWYSEDDDWLCPDGEERHEP
jgi:hypothetical protein